MNKQEDKEAVEFTIGLSIATAICVGVCVYAALIGASPIIVAGLAAVSVFLFLMALLFAAVYVATPIAEYLRHILTSRVGE